MRSFNLGFTLVPLAISTDRRSERVMQINVRTRYSPAVTAARMSPLCGAKSGHSCFAAGWGSA